MVAMATSSPNFILEGLERPVVRWGLAWMGLEFTGFRTLGLYYPDALKEARGLSSELELSPVTLSSVPGLMIPYEERQDPGCFFFLT